MHVFYTPDILLSSEMPEDESLHCVKVLRLPEGEEVRLTDGKGSFYRARIVRAHPKRCAVEILETLEDTDVRDFTIHIAIAPTKNMDRIEWFAEKVTEIGIDEISLIIENKAEIRAIHPNHSNVTAMCHGIVKHYRFSIGGKPWIRNLLTILPVSQLSKILPGTVNNSQVGSPIYFIHKDDRSRAAQRRGMPTVLRAA